MSREKKTVIHTQTLSAQGEDRGSMGGRSSKRHWTANERTNEPTSSEGTYVDHLLSSTARDTHASQAEARNILTDGSVVCAVLCCVAAAAGWAGDFNSSADRNTLNRSFRFIVRCIREQRRTDAVRLAGWLSGSMDGMGWEFEVGGRADRTGLAFAGECACCGLSASVTWVESSLFRYVCDSRDAMMMMMTANGNVFMFLFGCMFLCIAGWCS